MEIKDCRVLVLKDEQVSNITKEMLARMGFREDNIFLAGNIKKAEDAIISTRFNLILVGVDDGRVLLTWLQETGIRRLISFIFYSGGGEYYIKQKTEEYGADEYISLPVNVATLESKLREVLLKK